MNIEKIVSKIKSTWVNGNVKNYVFVFLYADNKGISVEQACSELQFTPDFESKDIAHNKDQRVEKLRDLRALCRKIELKEIGVFCDLILSSYVENGGKCAGQFFTPKEVGKLMARIGYADNENIRTIYDPTCGAGNLLEEARNTIKNDIVLYGTELNFSLLLGAKARLFKTKNELKHGDLFAVTDTNKYDFIISNPPFGTDIKGTRWDNIYNKKISGNWAFILEAFDKLKDGCLMCVQHTPSILSNEKDSFIRDKMADAIEGIINLPSKIFINTPISTIILVMRKGGRKRERFYIDATQPWGYTTNKKLNIINTDAIFELWKNKEPVKGKCDFCPDFDFSFKEEQPDEVIDPRALLDELERLDAKARENHKRLRALLWKLEGWQ
ncbi:MAG: N-6 DNA methylase [Methanobrevibacter sp.]|nr:N-6 DNA methylase [Methanobrevibacter sp.]